MSIKGRLARLEQRHAPEGDGEMKAARDAALRKLGVDPATVKHDPAEAAKHPFLPGESLAAYISRRIDEIEVRQ